MKKVLIILFISILPLSVNAQNWQFKVAYTPLEIGIYQFTNMEQELESRRLTSFSNRQAFMGMGLQIFYKKLGLHSDVLISYPSFDEHIQTASFQTNLYLSYPIYKDILKTTLGVGAFDFRYTTEQNFYNSYQQYVNQPETLRLHYLNITQDIGMIYVNTQNKFEIHGGYRFSGVRPWGLPAQELEGATTDRLHYWYLSFKKIVNVPRKKSAK